MKKYWLSLTLVLVGTFTILGFYGREVYRQAPPIYSELQDSSGQKIYTKEDILDGQVIWQSIGGQQVGSIWGHGAYQAPDWTADWLHRELVHYQEIYSQKKYSKVFSETNSSEKLLIKSAMLTDYRESQVVDGIVKLSEIRHEAFLKTRD